MAIVPDQSDEQLFKAGRVTPGVSLAFRKHRLSADDYNTLRHFMKANAKKGMDVKPYKEAIAKRHGQPAAERIWSDEDAQKLTQMARPPGPTPAPKGGPKEQRTREELKEFLYNIKLSDIPGWKKRMDGQIVATRDTKYWIRHFCFLLTRRGDDPAPFLKRLESFFSAEDMGRILELAMKALDNACLVNATRSVFDDSVEPDLGSRDEDEEARYLSALSYNLAYKDVPSLRSPDEDSKDKKKLSTISALWIQDKIRRILKKNLPITPFMMKLSGMFSSSLRLVFASTFCNEIQQELLPRYTKPAESLQEWLTLGFSAPMPILPPTQTATVQLPNIIATTNTDAQNSIIPTDPTSAKDPSDSIQNILEKMAKKAAEASMYKKPKSTSVQIEKKEMRSLYNGGSTADAIFQASQQQRGAPNWQAQCGPIVGPICPQPDPYNTNWAATQPVVPQETFGKGKKRSRKNDSDSNIPFALPSYPPNQSFWQPEYGTGAPNTTAQQMQPKPLMPFVKPPKPRPLFEWVTVNEPPPQPEPPEQEESESSDEEEEDEEEPAKPLDFISPEQVLGDFGFKYTDFSSSDDKEKEKKKTKKEKSGDNSEDSSTIPVNPFPPDRHDSGLGVIRERAYVPLKSKHLDKLDRERGVAEKPVIIERLVPVYIPVPVMEPPASSAPRPDLQRPSLLRRPEIEYNYDEDQFSKSSTYGRSYKQRGTGPPGPARRSPFNEYDEEMKPQTYEKDRFSGSRIISGYPERFGRTTYREPNARSPYEDRDNFGYYQNPMSTAARPDVVDYGAKVRLGYEFGFKR